MSEEDEEVERSAEGARPSDGAKQLETLLNLLRAERDYLAHRVTQLDEQLLPFHGLPVFKNEEDTTRSSLTPEELDTLLRTAESEPNTTRTRLYNIVKEVSPGQAPINRRYFGELLEFLKRTGRYVGGARAPSAGKARADDDDDDDHPTPKGNKVAPASKAAPAPAVAAPSKAANKKAKAPSPSSSSSVSSDESDSPKLEPLPPAKKSAAAPAKADKRDRADAETAAATAKKPKTKSADKQKRK